MGEPEPLDLELLQQGNENEIGRAIRELGLLQYAQAIVFSRIGSRYGFDVKAVALQALQELFDDAIEDVHNIEAIRPMLATISFRKAINFVNVGFRRREREHEQEFVDWLRNPQEVAAAPDPNEVMQNILVEGLGIDGFELAQVVSVVIELSKLGATEEHLLADHILGGMKQREFADRYGVPLRGIGGRKKRLLKKIRAALSGRSGELREILRRNREMGLMDRR